MDNIDEISLLQTLQRELLRKMFIVCSTFFRTIFRLILVIVYLIRLRYLTFLIHLLQFHIYKGS